ncbi:MULTISPECIES: hypothetical protein [Bacillus]|uniref:hypothetical protein n=1 Tax=Bacillus TaxID=1386 RepID=UPI000992C555|nr:hypothetical protein [Bacillus mycoides]OOR63425.1 hypothetical protein BLX04_08145 [Bacillus mycoides]
MSRTADYTVQGFLYQFHKGLYELLDSTDETEITVEGIVEDIDVTVEDGIRAIQCKYHEAKTVFNLSDIYKPVLQMMEHFYQNGNVSKNVKYVLFAYFPNYEGTTFALTEEHINEIFESKNKTYQRYINLLKGNLKINDFLSCFELEFGPSMEKLVEDIQQRFEQEGFDKVDIETLLYPNAIQKIAEISSKHTVQQRGIVKKDFIHNLKRIRKTAITKWTMALKNYRQILKTRKDQLRINLQQNSRSRYFVIKDNVVKDFDVHIVNFMKEYCDKYFVKPIQNKTPLFCIDCPKEKLLEIERRLFEKGINTETGKIGQAFYKTRFVREPMVKTKNGKILEREFDVKLLHYSNFDVIKEHKCDDLFLISNNLDIDIKDVEVEKIELSTFDEIKYILGMRATYE